MIWEDQKKELENLWPIAWDDNYDDEYAFGEDVVKTIPEVKGDVWATANQWTNKETRSACTMVWAISQLQRLFQLDLSMEERNKLDIEIVNYAVTKWYVIWTWWSTYTACKTVVEWWNNVGADRYNKEKVFYLRVLWSNPLVLKVLNKGHLVWYTKTLQFWADQINGYVYKDSYKQMLWHRLNLKWAEYTVATWWAQRQWAIYGSEDNYHWQIGENFFIKDIKPYINNWLYSYVYIILPVSAMEGTVEENKNDIAETKAINYVLGSLTTAWSNVPKKYQEKFAELAKEMREDYTDARQLENEPNKKWAEAAVDWLSYLWQFADKEDQEKFAQLAKELRDKYNFK